jgi:hypothetical protein
MSFVKIGLAKAILYFATYVQVACVSTVLSDMDEIRFNAVSFVTICAKEAMHFLWVS